MMLDNEGREILLGNLNSLYVPPLIMNRNVALNVSWAFIAGRICVSFFEIIGVTRSSSQRYDASSVRT